MSEIASTVVATETPVNTDSISNFSFDSLHDKALSMLEGGNTQPAEAVEQVASPDASAQNVDNASQAQLAQLSDDQLVEVTVDGQPVTMPWSEAKGGVMRQAKFTKEMQTLRSQQQAFETERQSLTNAQQERNALVNLLNNEQLLAQLIVQKYPHWVQQQQQAAAAAGQQIAQDPDDIMSRGEVQNITQGAVQSLQQLMNQVKADLEQKVAAVTETIEDRQAVAKLSADINTTIKGLFSEHPYITNVVPEAEQMLRFQVSKMAPNTPEETVEAFKTVFGGWVENYKAAVANTTKQNVITKQKLVDNNIQPRGGSEVTPQPLQTFKTNPMTGKRDLDWGALHEAAMNKLNG